MNTTSSEVESRAALVTAALHEAPDNRDHGAVRAYLHRLCDLGLSVLFVYPGAKTPADLRTARQRNADDKAARDAAREAGRRDWQKAKSPSGFELASTDVATLAGYLDRYISTYSTADEPVAVNLAVEVGRSRLAVVDADTPEQVAAFEAACTAGGMAATPATVSTPGVRNEVTGELVHHDGGHWYFTVPKGVEMPTNAGSMKASVGDADDGGAGYMVRWDRGYVLIPPSTRPEGAYKAVGAVTELPAWLHEQIAEHDRLRAERAARSRGAAAHDGPVAAWGASITWAEILADTDWVNTGKPDNCSCDIWTAPGPHSSPKSATAHEPGCTFYDSPDPPLHIWTDHDIEPFTDCVRGAEGRTVTRLDAVAAIHYENNVGAAMTALNLHDDEPQILTAGMVGDDGASTATEVDDGDDQGAGPGGLFVNIAAVLDGGGTPKATPTVLARSDGKCLFYPGKANLLFGDPETAKTWIALAAGAETMLAGGRFVFVDMDHNGVDTTLERLHMMGVDRAVLADPARFLYVEPEDKGHLCKVVAALAEWRPSMALLDSVGELLPLMGASSNNNDEVTTVFRDVVSPLAKAGAVVVLIDHLAKNADSRRLGPVGAYGKTRIFNGAMVRVFRVEQFTPGQGGVSSLWVHKDRPGAVRRETAPPDADSDDGGDPDEIRRDNLRRWGVFRMSSTPVRDRGKPVLDAEGYPRESLSWEILRPKGLHGVAAGAEMHDPRNGGRPRGNGVNDVGSPKYEVAVAKVIAQLCKLKREGRITDKTSKTAVREGFIKGSREPLTGAWERWTAADRPDDPSKVSPLTPVDPFDMPA